MDWFYPKRRGPEWKQGWTNQTISSMSALPFQLIAVFAIVTALLWFSQYTGYKSRVQQSSANFQVLLLLLPLLVILFMALYSSARWPELRLGRSRHEPLMSPLQPAPVAAASGNSPWGVAVFVVVLLVLLSYQSSFHSKWFGGSGD